MYCPNCGQPAPTDALRFCRQCGFRLDSVAQLINTGGAPLVYPQQSMAPMPALPLAESPRRKGLKLGAKLLLTSLVILPFFILFAIEAVDSPFPLFLPFTIFLAGVARLIYARAFEENYPQTMPVFQPVASPVAPPRPQVMMPPPQPSQMNLPPMAANTNDLYEPQSVTEPTTSLLKQPK